MTSERLGEIFEGNWAEKFLFMLSKSVDFVILFLLEKFAYWNFKA
jgi:hypothetical protein